MKYTIKLHDFERNNKIINIPYRQIDKISSCIMRDGINNWYVTSIHKKGSNQYDCITVCEDIPTIMEKIMRVDSNFNNTLELYDKGCAPIKDIIDNNRKNYGVEMDEDEVMRWKDACFINNYGAYSM